jgi:glycosyltransferase involved in cell wall biosynthesis
MAKKKRIQPDKLLWRVLSDGAQELKEEYDLAIAYLEGGSAYFVADHVKAKKKVAFIHIDYNLAGYTRSLDKKCYLKFDRIFTVSGEVKEHFLENYPECKKKTFVFHNMLDEEKIKSFSLKKGGFKDDFTGVRILTVGRLVYQKGYDLAIETMKLLKDTGYEVRWYVLGEGDLRGDLEEQIKELGLENDFILLGAKKNPYPYYRQADLYAHFTRFEGKSIAIQEAQILGKPIIASNCSGNREQIVNGVDGILCDLQPQKMKEAIISLLENKELSKEYGKKSLHKQIAYEEDINMLFTLL